MTAAPAIEPPSKTTAQGNRFWPRIGVVVVVFLVPLLLLALPSPPIKGKPAAKKRDWVLGAALVVAAGSMVAYVVPTPLFPRRRSVLPLILGGASLLVACNALWNDAYLDYVTAHKSYRREVFRRAMHNYHAPMYGRYDNAAVRLSDADGTAGYSFATLPFALLAAGVGGAWYAWARRRPLEARWEWKSFAVLLSLQLATIILFAACEPWPTRFSLNISGYSEFKKDIASFHGVANTLRHYVEKMPTLQWYGQHYPPGNLIVLTIEKSLGIPGLTKSIVCLLTVLSAVPLYLLARELELDDVATSAAILLFTASTGVLIYCTINTTSLLLFPGTICLWMLVRGLKTGSIAAAALLGLFFAFYLLFSFSASILGVLMALTTALAWLIGAATTRNVLRTGAISLVTVGVAIGLLYLTTKFNLVACFLTAVRGHQTQQGNEGFDDARRWLLRSTGNILAYLIGIVPLSILALGAAWGAVRGSAASRAKPQAAGDALQRTAVVGMQRSLFVATVLTIVLAGCSGLFYVETERIWIFLTPFFALAAGSELARRSEQEGPRVVYVTLLLVLLISCSQEFLFQHYR